MQHISAWVVFALSLVSADLVHAQTREEVLRCRAIEEEPRRLACYDALVLSPAAARSKYEAVSLEDLEAYALSYRGTLVEAKGWIEPGERFFLLKRTPQDARSLPVDIRALSRNEQQEVRDVCGSGCEATVRGRVGPVNFTTGIAAEAVLVP